MKPVAQSLAVEQVSPAALAVAIKVSAAHNAGHKRSRGHLGGEDVILRDLPDLAIMLVISVTRRPGCLVVVVHRTSGGDLGQGGLYGDWRLRTSGEIGRWEEQETEKNRIAKTADAISTWRADGACKRPHSDPDPPLGRL